MNIRHILIAVAASSLVTPAFAQAATAMAAPAMPKVGQTLRDANQMRLGPIERVEKDGSVRIIYQQRLAMIPASTITIADGKAQTSLTKKEVGKLQ